MRNDSVLEKKAQKWLCRSRSGRVDVRDHLKWSRKSKKETDKIITEVKQDRPVGSHDIVEGLKVHSRQFKEKLARFLRTT